MLWTYTRAERSFELETRYDEEAASYLLMWRSPDGRSRMERHPDRAQFRARLIILEQQLVASGWTSPLPQLIFLVMAG